ncbi:hypothetical protein N7G274_003973, partial [Stereocaulon virgatum]
MRLGASIGSFGGHTAIDPNTGADVVTSKEQNAAEIMFSAYLLMRLLFGTIRLSVLLFYRRIFLGRIFNRCSIAICVLIVLWSLSFCLSVAFQCGTHIEYSWTPVLDVTKCDKDKIWELSFGITDVVTDLMVLAIPLPIIFKLHMSTLRKVGLCGIFFSRTIFYGISHREASGNTTTGYRDLIAVLTTVAVWSQVEAGIAVITACLPSIRPLFHRKSLESLVNSLRSAISLHSLTDSQHRPDRDNEPTHRDTAIILDKVGKGKSGNVYPTIDTEITGNCNSSDDVP